MLDIVEKLEQRLVALDEAMPDPANVNDRRKLIELNRERRGIVSMEALEFYKSYDVGLLWNTSPSGFRWRIVSQRLLKAAASPREHVLESLIKAWPFRAKQVTHWLSDVKLSIDTKEDLAFAREVGEAVGWAAPADNIIAEAIRRRADLRKADAT